MRAVVLLGLLALSACELPPLTLRFAITDDPSQQCRSDAETIATSCSEISICDAVLSIRIIPPNDPTVPYISVCRPLTGGRGKLCAIATEDLPQPTVPIPEQVLEVQMAVFPRSAVSVDPDTGDLVCPRVEFAANGQPVAALPACGDDLDPSSCPSVPAVGGRTFYHPGDTETVVRLGCTDQQQLLTCEQTRIIEVSASINDFDDLVSSVAPTTADRLDVGIGEPKPFGDAFVLNTTETRELVRETSSATWSTALTDLTFLSTACLTVLEDGAETTTALTCRSVSPTSDRIDMAGIYVKKATLGQILTALGMTSFPDQGLVIGMVVDEFFNPVSGVQVNATCPSCTVKYLAADRMGLVAGGTSTAGIFLSEDAPFGTTFSIPSVVAQPALGGLVEGKVTVVIIQDKAPIGP